VTDADAIHGPTVFAVAWIPKLRHYDRVPRGLDRHRNKWVWRGMLWTGNAAPPSEFGGLRDFQRYLAFKDYRGIVGCRNVTLRPGGEGEDPYVGSVTEIRKAGYTPVKFSLKRPWASFDVGFHRRGEEAVIRTLTSGADVDFVSTGVNLEFRVSKKLNWFHKLVTRHRLPYASMDIQYQLACDGGYYIEIASTDIPNVTVYFDWVAVARYSIANIGLDDVHQFLTADTRRTPPPRPDRFRISGRVGGERTITPLEGT
jgi:hypothetical protein